MHMQRLGVSSALAAFQPSNADSAYDAMYLLFYLVPLALITIWYFTRTWLNYRRYHQVETSDDESFSFRDFIHSMPLIPEHWGSRTGANTRTGSFQADLEAGLTSDNFDISSNVRNGDPRTGLDRGDEIKTIMTTEKCGFDEARKIYHERALKSHNIDPLTGIPLDPKAVFFLPRT